jgi:hypothetical protein
MLVKTDDLISQLSQDLKPVKTPEKPFVFAIKWGVLSLALIVIMILGLQPRIDLLQSLQQFDTWVQLGAFALLLFASLALVSWASSPGKDGFKKYLKAVFALLSGLAVIQVVRVLGLSEVLLMEGLSVLGSRCALVAMAVGVATGLFVTWKVRAGASTHPLLSGLVVGLAAVGAGGVAITLHCASSNGMHILVWHFLLPLVVMTMVGSLVGRKILRW